MDILSIAYIVPIPVLFFIAFLIITRKDKKEHSLLKNRIMDSITAKSESARSSSSTESANEDDKKQVMGYR